MKNHYIDTIYHMIIKSNIFSINVIRDEEYALVFWKEVLFEFYYHVNFRLSMNRSYIIKSFILHNRKPSGLSNIIVNIFIFNVFRMN
jgi:hypothetical protein